VADCRWTCGGVPLSFRGGQAEARTAGAECGRRRYDCVQCSLVSAVKCCDTRKYLLGGECARFLPIHDLK